jgi:TldD protein
VSTRQVDPEFRELPLQALADAALQRAGELGAGHADLRVQRVRESVLRLRDGHLSTSADTTDSGLAVRVLVDGVWGFAATTRLDADQAAATAELAAQMARISRPLATQRVELADEPVHAGAEWVSDYADDPFDVPIADRVGLLATWSAELLDDDAVDHVDVRVQAAKEQKYYADLAGTTTLQQRVLISPELTAVAVAADGSGAETMRSLAPASARGWEFMRGDGWDWETELAELPGHLAERMSAPSVEPGQYDLVIDPTNLFLTIHESIGHATELDRALGYEAAYAGTSFATLDQLGSLRYGSELMNVTGDRTVQHGCATIGYDDDGVATRRWDIVSGGVLVGYQLDRRMARMCGLGASNGCAYADSASHVPVQRMANVSLQAAPGGPSTEEIIAGVDRGIYIVGDKSWSIDMQRYNFQFTGQRFYRIAGGRLAGQLKDVAYQASTPQFWGSLSAVGGPQTYYLGGSPNCGKAQPAQTAWVSHGCPATLFRGVRVLNTRQEAAR